jgi:hypothetical protein
MTFQYFIIATIILPLAALAYFSMTHFEYGRDSPYEDTDRFRDPRVSGVIQLWAVDNQMNEYIAVTIARS